MNKKWRAKIIVLALGIMLAFAVGNVRWVAAAGEEPLRNAETGDVDGVTGNRDVDVDGELQNDSVFIEGLPPTIPLTTPSTTQVGGKVVDGPGKGVQTGDVLRSANILAVFFLGTGFLFLLIKRRNKSENTEEM